MFPLTPELRTVLEKQREWVRGLERATGQIIPWVFVHDDGTPILNFRYSWKKPVAKPACRKGTFTISDGPRSVTLNAPASPDRPL
jgi:integrase